MNYVIEVTPIIYNKMGRNSFEDGVYNKLEF